MPSARGDATTVTAEVSPVVTATSNRSARVFRNDRSDSSCQSVCSTELRAPPHVIGRRTEECIQSGVLYGTADAVDGIVRRIRAEWPDGRTPGVVATGGLASVIAPLTTTIERTDQQLTLQGLRMAAGYVGLRW